MEDPKGLEARELGSAVNSDALLEQHRGNTEGCVRTRFPPEPNGYLHVGHAKSMHMNFRLAFEKLGIPPELRRTIFRYDDTNPEAESQEYIDSLREDLHWMGWVPFRTTFTSDYFDVFYELALRLIREDKAYVCHQTKDDIARCREIARARLMDPEAPGDPCSPWRNRPVDESLREFDNMRKGMYAEGAACLRMKMDMNSVNYNMWDQVAYRIKYVPHPHIGNKWCIYPTYDYTHCIVDSLEEIDYSICTLEFETRRESYYWVLEVYEFARLNITYTVLSKRKLLKLVRIGFVRGWDDPRMPTIRGLRRRGYTPLALNNFCEDVGVTRNEQHIEYERLQHWVRTALNDTAPRLMAVLDPLRIHITNFIETYGSASTQITAPDFPQNPEKGEHQLPFEEYVYIDRSDFSFTASPDYYGFAVGKICNLKYAASVRCNEVLTDEQGAPVLLRVSIVETGEKLKGNITWVPAASGLACEVRLYGHLFTVPNPDEEWEAQLNHESEIVKPSARVDPSILKWEIHTNAHFQFERHGFFVVDYDTVYTAGAESKSRIVFNRTVPLKESGLKHAAQTNHSRKEEQMKNLAEKEAKRSVRPEDMFKDPATYSEWDEFGVPRKDKDGQPLTKSQVKKLKKEWEKQKKLYESSRSNA